MPIATTTTTTTQATTTTTTVPATPQWPVRQGSSTEGTAIATSANGSSMVLGIAGTYLSVMKLSSLGNQEWLQKAAGASGFRGTAIATNSDGSAVITGEFLSTVVFGSVTLQSTVGGKDIFVAKISSTGTWLWATKVGGEGPETAGQLSLAEDGSAMITGAFQESVAFNSTTLTSSGRSDAFVAKISSTGTWLWATKAGGVMDDVMTAQAVLSDGSVVVGGYHNSSTISFGTIALDGSRWFLARLNSLGEWSWAINIGAESQISSIASAPENAVLIAGHFSGSSQFGTSTLTSNGIADIYVAKISSSGTWLWVAQAGGGGMDYCFSISRLSDGSAILTGQFERSATFGSARITELGSADVFVAKISVTGSWLWASSFGSITLDRGYGVATFSDGSAVMTGNSNYGGFIAKVLADGSILGM
jgi:hypothetical protein